MPLGHGEHAIQAPTPLLSSLNRQDAKAAKNFDGMNGTSRRVGWASAHADSDATTKPSERPMGATVKRSLRVIGVSSDRTPK